MEIIEELKSNEKMLALRAAAMHVPFAGTFELTPICNMNCRMCYIRTSFQEMEKQGTMLTAEEWIQIASEARNMGLLYLLLTGGEPLLYPEFDKLYSWLGESGIVVMLNANGTLLTEERADLLLKERNIPVKLNCSLTPLNFHDLKEMHRIADELGVPFQVTPYMFPPVRKNDIEITDFTRFDPEIAAYVICDLYVIYALPPVLLKPGAGMAVLNIYVG